MVVLGGAYIGDDWLMRRIYRLADDCEMTRGKSLMKAANLNLVSWQRPAQGFYWICRNWM
jgi:hypothetical protein